MLCYVGCNVVNDDRRALRERQQFADVTEVEVTALPQPLLLLLPLLLPLMLLLPIMLLLMPTHPLLMTIVSSTPGASSTSGSVWAVEDVILCRRAWRRWWVGVTGSCRDSALSCVLTGASCSTMIGASCDARGRDNVVVIIVVRRTAGWRRRAVSSPLCCCCWSASWYFSTTPQNSEYSTNERHCSRRYEIFKARPKTDIYWLAIPIILISKWAKTWQR